MARPVGRIPQSLRSMRLRVLVVVLVVVFAPVLVVWFSTVTDSTVDAQMQTDLNLASSQTQQVLAENPPGAWTELLDQIAWDHEVRILVVDAQGDVLTTRDREDGESIGRWVGAWFYGPGGAPSLRDWEQTRGPLSEREEFRDALARGEWAGCSEVDASRLLVCQRLIRVETTMGPAVMIIQQSSRRAIRALYDQRYQLLSLALVSLPFGLFLAWWLGMRVVRPLEILRRQVLSRRETPHILEPIEYRRADEYGELAGAFNGLLEALDQRNRAYETFVADLAHELKNPVAAVRVAAESMAKSNEQGLTAARTARLSRVLTDSSGRLEELVNRFLELARAEAGLPNVERDLVRLDQLVQGLAKTLGDDPRHAAITFEVQLVEVTVEGVSERLETALRNLMENAASFAGEDGTVGVTMRVEGDSVYVEVSDTGPGIAVEDRHRVFDRFFTRRADDRGTGLGLALVRAIVEAHGGAIEATSSGSGAVLVFWIPLGS